MNFQWSDAARGALAVFFTKWNDIDVFVEDTAGHADSIYRVLVNRILNGNACVEKVFSLGPRQNVIDACRVDIAKTGRPRIYLIDGDLDLLIGKRVPPTLRLFQHRVYAIENYLLAECALVEILHEENPRCSKELIRLKLDYSNWLKIIDELSLLFITFGISNKLSPELPTISLGIGNFITEDKIPQLDSKKVDAFCMARKKQILLKVNKKEFDETEAVVKKQLASVDETLDMLAARDFVFPLLRFWLKSKGIALKASNETLQLRLAKVVPLERHHEFASQLRGTANSH